MTLCGIVCEYNPFHLGHAALIASARAALGECGVVCAMSGDYVQRGEPAVLREGARAAAALRGGADLVVSLPLPWAIASAERFALGGVSVLASLGLPMKLVFGSESGDGGALRRIFSVLGTPEAETLTDENLRRGLPYAAARQKALDELAPDVSAVLKNPNDLLGVEYMKAIRRLGAPLEPMPVKRFGPPRGEAAGGCLASASVLREMLAAGADIGEYVPAAAAELYRAELAAGRAPVTPGRLDGALMYRLRTMTDAEYAALPDATEGLWARLARAGRSETTPEGVISAAKTKRYARSRLCRMTLSALLGVTAADSAGLPPYIRVLAANRRGAEILHEAKRTASVPFVTKPASARALPEPARSLFALEARAADVYALLYPAQEARAGGSLWRSGPVIAEEP